MKGAKASDEEIRLHQLLRDAEIAKGGKDKWGLTPIEKGWLRGHVTELNQYEVPCEYGTLQIIEFDLRENMKEPGVPVKMQGTYFNGRLMEGAVMDVPDPTPSKRPIEPWEIYPSHHNRTIELTAYYPGRNLQTQRMSLLLAAGAVGGPILVLCGIIALLHYALHIF